MLVPAWRRCLCGPRKRACGKRGGPRRSSARGVWEGWVSPDARSERAGYHWIPFRRSGLFCCTLLRLTILDFHAQPVTHVCPLHRWGGLQWTVGHQSIQNVRCGSRIPQRMEGGRAGKPGGDGGEGGMLRSANATAPYSNGTASASRADRHHARRHHIYRRHTRPHRARRHHCSSLDACGSAPGSHTHEPRAAMQGRHALAAPCFYSAEG